MGGIIRTLGNGLWRQPLLAVFVFVCGTVTALCLIGLSVLAGGFLLPAVVPTGVIGPSIRITPEASQPGALITVIGEGWQPGDTVFIGLDSNMQGLRSPIASTVAAADGRFVVAFVLPAEAGATQPRVPVVAWSSTLSSEAETPLQVLGPAETDTPTPTTTPVQTATPAPATSTSTPAPPPTATSTPRPTAPPPATPTPAITAWRGEYFSNVTLIGAPALVRDDAAINFIWGRGAPANVLPADSFSVRWTRALGFEEGLYRFHAVVDDGVRLYVDGALVIDAWRDGARRELTADHRLTAGVHGLRIEYYEHAGDALIQVWWEKLSSYPDWKGEYWPNRTLTGNPVLVRNDANVVFNWGAGAPAANVPADNFAARWTRALNFDGATYRFHVFVDDGARLWVDEQLILDAWRDGSARELTVDHALVQGIHSLRVEYYENAGQALIRVWWEKVVSPSYPDWQGEYWSNATLSGSPALVRNDVALDFYWNMAAPAVGLPVDNFSARWSRQVNFAPAVYRFYAWADDGVRLYVDGNLVLNEWHDSNASEVYMVDLPLTGTRQLTAEYYERGGAALIKVWWKRVGDWPTPTPTTPPTATPTAPPTPTTTPTLTPTLTPTATPTQALTVGVRLNEILPVPAAVDWSRDGVLDNRDEWIELYNSASTAVDLSRWALDNGAESTASYRFADGTLLQPGAYLVLYRERTGFVLTDGGGQVRLLKPDGTVADTVTYPALAPDASYSRDAAGGWHADWPPSPGAPNRPLA